jgi:hypothetical protein
MLNQVFSINGNKISSFIADENSLKFSSQANFTTVDEFLESYKKKLSLATKVEVKYDSIKSIRKEDNDKKILIKYKTWAGIASNCEFSFNNDEDYETFFHFLEKERYFIRTHETLTPFKAIKNHLLGLAFTIAITIFSYYQALAIANGTVEEAHNGKTRLFNALVGLLGDKGVLAAGALIACYLLYRIWLRYKNPPNQLRFLPPKGY